jgi:zinc finger protein
MEISPSETGIGAAPGADHRSVFMAAPDDEESPPPLFLDISPNSLPHELESLCMNCHENGMTTLLLTKIPFFREVMISRFECPHCGYSDRGVQFAGEFPAKGVRYHLHVVSPQDLNRRVIKSGFGVVQVPAINLEIPGPTQADSISTVEGVLEQAYNGLRAAPQSAQLGEFLDNLFQCMKGLVQFDFILDDPSGNSFIENPHGPKADPGLSVTFYKRSPEQTEAIGLVPTPPTRGFELDSGERIESAFSEADSQVRTFPTDCPVCSTPGEMRSCTLNIPHFKEIVLMAFNCENCSYHNGEVMVGGSISPLARRITLRVAERRDLNREVLKSDVTAIRIPECDLELLPGTLGGKFTTVEGLVSDILKSLQNDNPFARGDSADAHTAAAYERTLSALRDFLAGSPFTFILDDPLANSYIQELPETPGSLIVEDYARTPEQDESLGIADMLTEEVATEAGVGYRRQNPE